MILIMADTRVANPMAIGTKTTTDADKLALALKSLVGETLTAFARTSVTDGKFVKRNISSGKSAQFPTSVVLKHIISKQVRALTTFAKTFSRVNVPLLLMVCSRPIALSSTSMNLSLIMISVALMRLSLGKHWPSLWMRLFSQK